MPAVKAIPSQVRVENRTQEFATDEKRFYLPAKVEVTCPVCGQIATHDFTDWYLSYPVINRPFTQVVHCMNHDPADPQEIEVRLVLRAAVMLAE